MKGKVRRSTRSRRRHIVDKIPVLALIGVCIAFAIVIVVAFNIAFGHHPGDDAQPGDPYPIKGVDVSLFQLDINWEGLEDEGYDFVFIKATEGSSYVDENFSANWDGANETDMRVGAYHFLSFDTAGKTQAENYINTVDKKWGMLPPVVDVEFYGEYSSVHPTKDKLWAKLDPVLELMEDEYGKTPIIYTNTYIYNKYIADRYEDYPIWISDPDIPESLPDGKVWTICQYSFRGHSDNVASGEKYVDLNVFNGSSWDFFKLAH